MLTGTEEVVLFLDVYFLSSVMGCVVLILTPFKLSPVNFGPTQ